MQLQSAALSDVGLQRDHNEDAYVADDVHGIYVVCDGMGGAAAGEDASAIALDRITQFFRPRVAELRRSDLNSPAVRQSLCRLADAAIQDACHHVYTAASNGKTGKPGMGTTLTFLVLIERIAVVGHVGDSRLYLNRNNTLYQITQDHTLSNELIRRGAMTAEEALKNPMGERLTRAVGPQANVVGDTNVLDVYDGDLFFLCSDGISKAVDNSAMLRALEAPTLKGACTHLVNAANAAGGDDNATVVMAKVKQDLGTSERKFIDSKTDALAAMTVFAGLSHAELSAVVSATGLRLVPAGAVITAAGSSHNEFYVLLSGGVVLRLHGADVIFIRPGQHFGTGDMFDSRPALLESVATEPSVVLTFDRAHLEDLFKRDLGLGVKLLWRFADMLSGHIYDVLQRGTLTQ